MVAASLSTQPLERPCAGDAGSRIMSTSRRASPKPARTCGKRGRPISHAGEEAKLERRRVLHGGTKRHNKLKRDQAAAESRCDAEKDSNKAVEKETLAEPRREWRSRIRGLKGDTEAQDAVKAERNATTKAAKAETRRLDREADGRLEDFRGKAKAAMKRCVVPQNAGDDQSPLQSRAANNSKMREAARASRHLENVLHLVSLFIVGWAVATGSLVVLEDLRNMPGGWGRGGKFGRSMRWKLHSAAMLKISGMIAYKARWAGIFPYHIRPYNTSKLCAACRYVLSGKDYHFRYCGRCGIRVDRDVNASRNLWLTAAAALYGVAVRTPLDEADWPAVKKLCFASPMTGGIAAAVDGESTFWLGG